MTPERLVLAHMRTTLTRGPVVLQSQYSRRSATPGRLRPAEIANPDLAVSDGNPVVRVLVDSSSEQLVT